MVTFSKSLIEEYKIEMSNTYGVFISDAEAQTQLKRLTRSMFPTDITVKNAESREQGARKGVLTPACAGSLSAKMVNDGGNEVGASITPTSGHINNNYYEK